MEKEPPPLDYAGRLPNRRRADQFWTWTAVVVFVAFPSLGVTLSILHHDEAAALTVTFLWPAAGLAVAWQNLICFRSGPLSVLGLVLGVASIVIPLGCVAWLLTNWHS